ncbi:MAG: anthranilate phosphoribosyltransferase [Candidatus Omnitrophota bacterium]|jgi:anthranilate phosphoribosyltransferase
MIIEALKELSQNKDLAAELMTQVMEEIMTGKVDTPHIASFLTALKKKGETPEELTAAASVMRRYVTKIHTRHKVILDTCGTGGDLKGTFNISTVAAFVVSGCGITVAKHGNRSVSSRSGSADILEALGVNIHLPPEKLEKCLDEAGIAFLFAPDLHPAMKYAAPARKQILTRTMFNLLGPLTNPAQATHQLVGVYDRNWTEPLARVLANLGTAHALVVFGKDGLDEISTAAETIVSEARHKEVRTYEISPEDFGFKRANLIDLLGSGASDNAQILLDILNGEDGPRKDIVLLNAGAAVFAADKAGSIKEGIELAQISIDSKKALEKFELLKEYSHK